MFKINRDIEYALIALVDMARHSEDELVTAKDISERYTIPFKLLARILQLLSNDGIVRSYKGRYGGYQLLITPEKLSFGRIIKAVRGEETITDCLSGDGNCVRLKCGCIIRPMMDLYQNKWVAFVENTTLEEFIQSQFNTEHEAIMSGGRS